METDNTKGKKRNQLLTSPNPIAMASAGLEATPSSPMPPAIHGGIAMENSDATIFKSNISQSEIEELL